MPYYNVCPHCGSNLDPGERCDCQREAPTTETKKPQHRAVAAMISRADTERTLVLAAKAKRA